MLKPGIYEQVMNELIHLGLKQAPDAIYEPVTSKLDEAESTKVLAHYMAAVIQSALATVSREDALRHRVSLCNDLIELLAKKTGDPYFLDFRIESQAELLLALLEPGDAARLAPRQQPSNVIRPQTSVAHSSLFTGAPLEPNMISELKREILSCDRVDMLVSFIKWSGLRLLMDELYEFTQTRPLRIITTSYMGATDIKAIDELRRLPNTHVRVSYDTERTRLHAKAYVFHRETGFSTAYIGSSNLSHAALSTGLEWNVKVTATDLAETFKKVAGTFESYWNDPEFALYEEGQRPFLMRALKAEQSQSDSATHFHFDITPYRFQQEILDRLDADRRVRGHYRNLIVAATGTGKTVISAFDYKRFCKERPGSRNRLLFVAHREEILRQSRDCFRAVLRDQNFGDLMVGGREPAGLDHLFISVQSLHSRALATQLAAEYYDYIVVDEFHHAAASSYQDLFRHFQPKILLGLTATPERMDGQDVTAYFDYHIAAEIRLPEAIERELLAPFQYFGVSDSVDLSQLRWRRSGYDVSELSQLYTGNRQRADLVVRSLRQYVTDPARVIGLCFCVSVEHAQFMASFLSQHGFPAQALHAQSPSDQRSAAARQLVSGAVKFVCVVDLYNEGIDIPEINTVVFLRPTESLTVFLQQLGRGLRHSNGKECLTVLDFIGQAHKRYSFSAKFAALLTTRQPLRDEVAAGFPHVARGCFIQLERQAKEYVLDNIRQSIGTRMQLLASLRSFVEETDVPLTLGAWAEHVRLSMREVYAGSSPVSFARLCQRADLKEDFVEPDEAILTKALPRIAAINSRRWIAFLLCVLEGPIEAGALTWSSCEQQMFLMFHYTVWQKPLDELGFASLSDSLHALRANKTLTAEMCDVLRYNRVHIGFVDEPVQLGFVAPLDLHCDYSRDQVLAALGIYTEHTMPAMREGVRYVPDKKLDLLFVTLNKADKDYSPTTMYQDYAISDTLFHWQSQSTTPEDSPTGMRYVQHKQIGHRIVLFVREAKTDSSGTIPYTYLGTAEYVSHTGSRPMSITWRLHRPMPPALQHTASRLLVV